ncbi:MAG: hypothetical protein J7L41_04665 [Synergistetes bacterium]|nr:hypothetical protein [Synergistota bacterium]
MYARGLSTRDKGRAYGHKGCGGIRTGKQLAYEFIEKYRDRFPSLVKALKEDLDALLNHLKLPFRHRKSEKSFMDEVDFRDVC